MHQPNAFEIDWSRPGLPSWPDLLPKRSGCKAPAVATDWGSEGVPSPYLWPVHGVPKACAENLVMDWSIRGLPVTVRTGSNIKCAKKRIHQPPDISFDWSGLGRPNFGAVSPQHLHHQCFPHHGIGCPMFTAFLA